jgi:hypothetical protein
LIPSLPTPLRGEEKLFKAFRDFVDRFFGEAFEAAVEVAGGKF